MNGTEVYIEINSLYIILVLCFRDHSILIEKRWCKSELYRLYWWIWFQKFILLSSCSILKKSLLHFNCDEHWLIQQRNGWPPLRSRFRWRLCRLLREIHKTFTSTWYFMTIGKNLIMEYHETFVYSSNFKSFSHQMTFLWFVTTHDYMWSCRKICLMYFRNLDSCFLL